jgi:hypothetical protein
MLCRIAQQETAYGALCGYVQSYCRLVEKENTRPMEQYADELHFHSLTEAEPSELYVEKALDSELRGKLPERIFEIVVGNLVNMLQEKKAVSGGQIPPKLIFLSHEERYLAA